MALCLSGGAPQDSPQSPDSRDFLVGALLKNLALKGRIASDIQASDRELQTSERIFLEAENRMTIATETQNRQAEWEARGPLDKARSDLKKLKQARTRLDQAMARAEAAAAAISLLIPSGESADKPIWGLASLHSGKARVRSKSRTEVNLEVGRPRFLEPGDEVMTMGSSLAEIQALYGRATVLLGERARLGSEEDVPPNRALRLVQGRIYTIVDRQDEFAGLFQEGRFDLGADPRLEEAISRTRERTRELTDRRLIVRTPNACLDVSSVRCTVELSKNGAAEIVVLEGTVEAGDAGCSRMIPLEEGFMAVASEEGVSEPKKAAAIDKWWEK